MLRSIPIIAFVLVLFLALSNNNAFSADHDKLLTNIADQLDQTRIDLARIQLELAKLNRELNSQNISGITWILDHFTKFCSYEKKIILIFRHVKNEERKNIALYLHRQLIPIKGMFERAKKIFRLNYSALQHNSAIDLADEAKAKIDEVENLYDRLLNIYGSLYSQNQPSKQPIPDTIG